MKTSTSPGRTPAMVSTTTLMLHWLQYTVLAALAIPTLVLGLYWGQFKDLVDSAIAAMTVGF